MKLDQIIEQEYGVGAVACSPVVVLWAVEKITDKEQAKKELKRINNLRAKHGKPLAYAEYGSHAY